MDTEIHNLATNAVAILRMNIINVVKLVVESGPEVKLPYINVGEDGLIEYTWILKNATLTLNVKQNKEYEVLLDYLSKESIGSWDVYDNKEAAVERIKELFKEAKETRLIKAMTI